MVAPTSYGRPKDHHIAAQRPRHTRWQDGGRIHRLENTKWTLEVINREGASTVWDDQFDSAAAAKAEFLRSLAEEGLVAS
jgi:hypothetical protein